MRGPLDPNPGLRSEAQWRQMLGELVESLSAFTGIRFEPTSWAVGNDRPGSAIAAGSVDIRGIVNLALQLDACGGVAANVNFGYTANAWCELLLFARGRRVREPGGLSLMYLRYGEEGWSSQGWVVDEDAELESHATDARWRGV